MTDGIVLSDDVIRHCSCFSAMYEKQTTYKKHGIRMYITISLVMSIADFVQTTHFKRLELL